MAEVVQSLLLPAGIVKTSGYTMQTVTIARRPTNLDDPT